MTFTPQRYFYKHRWLVYLVSVVRRSRAQAKLSIQLNRKLVISLELSPLELSSLELSSLELKLLS